MSHQIIEQMQRHLSKMGFTGQIEKNSYGEQITFIPQRDAKHREVKMTLSYVKGLFENVPHPISGPTKLIYVWQIIFSYPFKIQAKNKHAALELINSINPRLAMPGFYLNEEEKTIAYTYCLIQMQNQLDQDLLFDILGCALNQYDHFLPEFEVF
jgi:hypothetical protein